MQLILTLLPALLPALVAGQTIISTTSQCFTARGSLSVKPVPTSSSTLRSRSVTATSVIVITPVKTITPAPVVTTVQSTDVSVKTITATQETDTVVTTSILSSTTTVTVAPSTVVRSTTTATTVIVSAANFSPVQSTLPDASDVPNVGTPSRIKRGQNSFPRLRRQAGDDNTDTDDNTLAPIDDLAAQRFPESVVCLSIINLYVQRTNTRTARRTRTTTLVPATTTTATTTTLVVTSTFVPGDASVTDTVTSTVVNVQLFTPPPVTTTITLTNTVTSTQAGASAMCSANNFANAVRGSGIISLSDPGNEGAEFLSTGDRTQEECCDSCSINPICDAFAFFDRFPLGRKCQVVVQRTGTCAEGQNTFQVGRDLTPGAAYTVGNGNCGFITA